MMKNKEMRKENVLLWPLFWAYFFCFPFWPKTHAWIPRKYDVLSNGFKIKQLQLSLEEKSTFFAAPEVMAEFSAAWCLSIVSQGAKVHSYSKYAICSGREWDKSRRTGFFLHVELLQFLLFARSSRRSFLRTVQSIQQYGSTEWNDVIQAESPENFVVIFEIYWQGMKEQRNYVLQILGELWF